MDWLSRMNDVMNYIEEHLTDEISYDEAARLACCSTYHFQRMFSFIADISISEYIRRRNCIGCGKCTFLCPMFNLTIHNKKAEGVDRCTMCCRCISTCPQKAITLLGKSVYEQCRYENYTGGV